jgi:hypothetical protein
MSQSNYHTQKRQPMSIFANTYMHSYSWRKDFGTTIRDSILLGFNNSEAFGYRVHLEI